ncbi:peptidyl-prolyl cis-trans isomerase [Robiginitalea sp. SC105]|uniref:peptidylprolyl isomerase n=1 Tax=Robiginitalea sp. SC105 TaxID=2762332 RepID=UPI00163A52EA|nr:peptidylprolyl isomerase [Robiginitalea sp. SC105]MBC2838859.1 peptidyl-prolyl cis-trans isomerase [Robiginitalea sp. SC105]
MKKLLKEPLVHFLLIGLGIFLLYSVISSDKDSRDEIVISDSDLRHMQEIYKLTWQREPTEEELVGIVSSAIREEILYREALKMNLDHDDEVVKRRLAQKMDFLSNDISAIINDPSENDLREYYQANADKYRLPARYTLRQVAFTFDNHSDPRKQAEKVLGQIQAGQVDPVNAGDALSLPGRFTGIYADRLQHELGGDFSEAISGLPAQKWAGPVRSGYGWHLIYIEEKEAPRLPGLEEVRGDLERDYAYEKERESQQRIYEQLRNGYDIELQANLSPGLAEKIIAKING